MMVGMERKEPPMHGREIRSAFLLPGAGQTFAGIDYSGFEMRMAYHEARVREALERLRRAWGVVK